MGDRWELCRACGDPLFVCPATVRTFIRCCRDCTHVTAADKAKAKWVADVRASRAALRHRGD